MKVFVICRDRISCLIQLLETIDHLDVTLVDNDSRYPPLLDFYETTKHKVVRLNWNVGQRSPWILGLVPQKERYIVTDPDIVPVSPDDWLHVMESVLDFCPDAVKVGFGLQIDNLPDHYAMKNQVIRWEQQWWTNKQVVCGYEVWRAPIDTTFALYRSGSSCGDRGADEMGLSLRLGPPYLAKHLAWYADSESPTEEEVFYKSRASSAANWLFDEASRSHNQ